ncbi:hypothetical protein FNH22_05105 [Fulvivirga sp. M361]|uniref:hypothetical protein n=1 Tax=Fulvivirga sp. M361 TaxID=2594266 RepID=UPI00117B9CE7|nr:hypothetical protein [Fulvivirga sp. M361]TRX61435.1 hypothetical protein FNH22_05105 [Fulvivirga sp. M361]
MTTFKTSSLALIGGVMLITSSPRSVQKVQTAFSEAITVCYTPRGCVFQTLFGEQASPHIDGYLPSEAITASLENGLSWIIQAQQHNGGWGAGTHQRQDVLDPHAVQADPATTAMVAMALLRTGNTLESGEYPEQLKKALFYLLDAVESTPDNRLKITTLSGTQIQTKLGDNIDAVLTAQFFSNIIPHLDNDQLKQRAKNSLNVCVDKIQEAQDADGSFKGSGWAGVLQSSLATTALESAEYEGAEIDEVVLEKARDYQKGNYDASSGKVKTDKGAGIVLYSVSGSVRSSAKEARKVKEAMQKAKINGELEEDADVSVENLMDIGYSREEAARYNTAYQVYESSKNTAQEDRVMSGFGNNGGEEFLSYLQTGESLVVNDDKDWEQWYKDISHRLLSIQNEDGSWNGHHCITSPVFCTATTLLTLSIHNDIERLTTLGRG